MKRIFLVMATCALPVATVAQPLPTITTTPLLPPTAQPQAPITTQAPANQTQVPQPETPKGPQQIQMTWVSQGSALLQVLDKVNAQNAVLTVKVGQQAQFESLSIQVEACSIHPPDQPQDSAAYLTITDSRADAPGFRGWMLANNPSLSMLQHPIYDVRVVGCRA